MHNKTAHEDIVRIMDALEGNETALACLLNFVKKWDDKCRKEFGMRQTLINTKERQKRGGGYL